jgi:adenylate cyclase
MAFEIERKFLLENANWREKADHGLLIKQGYLNSNSQRTVRVRIIGDRGFLTIKGSVIKITRPEFEYEIPVSDAIQLIELCEKPIIEKTRFIIKENGLCWEIDEFEGDNKGLTIAEIELEEENQTFEIPDWLGKEVSGDIKYYNSNLIKHPFIEW